MAVFFLSLSMTAISEDKVSCFDIKGMTCAACSVTIKAAVKKLDGIKSVDVFSEKGTAQVKFKANSLDPSTIAKTISRTGYEATEKSCN